jgi:RNA polymerase sigma factor (sigma-70 family)
VNSQLHSPTDQELVDGALGGDSTALEQLVTRHAPWIFNLAFYMLHHRQDAEDATQEILVKVITGLSSFRDLSSFRTWARRIAKNHLLDYRRSRPETVVTGFGCYAEYLDNAPNTELRDTNAPSAEHALLVEEARVSCTMGMLLCLDREQRLVFLLGELLQTSDVDGAEIVEISRDNFRQRLARAREQLSNFMQGRCGLVNPNNACRCARKTAAFIRDGIVDPNRLLFARGHIGHVASVVGDYEQQVGELMHQAQAHPIYPLFEAPQFNEMLNALARGAGHCPTHN